MASLIMRILLQNAVTIKRRNIMSTSHKLITVQATGAQWAALLMWGMNERLNTEGKREYKLAMEAIKDALMAEVAAEVGMKNGGKK
jgi:hypothetical protein